MEPKTKILFMLPSLGIGGIERHLLKQMQCFDRTKFDIQLALLFFYTDRPNLLAELPQDITVTKLGFAHGSMFNIRGWINAITLLRKYRPDIVFSSMFSGNTLSRVLKPFFGYSAIPREHNTYTDKNRLQILVDKLLAPLSYTIVSVSSMVADFAAEQAGIPRSKFTVIPNGVAIKEITAQAAEARGIGVATLRKEFSLADNERVIINVARIKKQKNHTLLVDAYDVYRKKGGAKKLFIIGDGSERPEIEAYIRSKQLQEHIILTGYRSDVRNFYALASLFVLSSDREGFPNVVLEALAWGVPVVSTRVAGVDEILKPGANGEIVERDPAVMADAMLEYETYTAERQRLCEESATAFDIYTNVARYEQLIYEALSAKNKK